MFPVDNIREVCKERGTTLAEVERALGIGNGVIAKWATGSPPYNRLVAIAEYLNVPLSRLTGDDGTKKQPTSQGDELIEILDACRERSDLRMLFKLSKNATPDDVRKAIAIIEALKND